MLRRTPLKRTGKIGLRNKDANRINYQRFADMGIDRCELCEGTFGLAVAHKNPREWYRSCPELLHDESQVAFFCQDCHSIVDDRSKTSKTESDEIFENLRT